MTNTTASAIPFNSPTIVGKELEYIERTLDGRHLSGDGSFTKRCHALIEETTGTAKALLTHSCTAALEMGALLSEVGLGDEVIMPSFTFVSTANAFVLRGAVPVFVDIRADTLNLDERLVADAITSRTKAIVPVHYAGVACAMDTLNQIAADNRLMVIEDAAQGLGATWRGRPLGSIGALGCLSFHETKNVVSGEGGALLVNDERLLERAEIIREKGTNRSRFFRGQVDKYTWVDVGSSFLPSDLIAAVLLAQLEQMRELNRRRLEIWGQYHQAFESLERDGAVRRPVIPDDCEHNAHMYYLLLPSLEYRTAALAKLRERGIGAVFHYVPLHSAPAGVKYGRAHGGALPVTDKVSETLIRLPLWPDVYPRINEVIDAVADTLQR
ncbi:MAG TPA: dTDP-4-amino-4,6-dideoxygalactose transaminase [Gemmatimonadaceae bacterium]|jgi:dTDP-4-amino-4,6-dideoxygalactose transaminase|nr:dTDP-4-amino-4,6-dideoxygalactose transaminase [Gemmatimonadaceae bacterium]